MKIIKDFQLQVVKQDFNLNCIVHLIIKKSQYDTPLKLLEEHTKKIELLS